MALEKRRLKKWFTAGDKKEKQVMQMIIHLLLTKYSSADFLFYSWRLFFFRSAGEHFLAFFLQPWFFCFFLYQDKKKEIKKPEYNFQNSEGLIKNVYKCIVETGARLFWQKL